MRLRYIALFIHLITLSLELNGVETVGPNTFHFAKESYSTWIVFFFIFQLTNQLYVDNINKTQFDIVAELINPYN